MSPVLDGEQRRTLGSLFQCLCAGNRRVKIETPLLSKVAWCIPIRRLPAGGKHAHEEYLSFPGYQAVRTSHDSNIISRMNNL